MKFKEKYELEYGAVLEEVSPLLSKASLRFSEIQVPGADGSIFNEEGYKPVTGKIVFMLRRNNEDEFKAWMGGVGKLAIDDKETNMRVYDGYELERVALLKRAEVNFIRDPFWLKEADYYKTVTTSITNYGNIISRPKIRLIKTTNDVVDITINGTRFVYTFDTDGAVVIDCDAKTETWGLNNKSFNLQVGWEYPFLNVGDNLITFNTGTCSIEVLHESRWV